LQSADFDKYLKLFEEGLIAEQVYLIMELFGDQGSAAVMEEVL
jgi:hypothetical protein